MTADLSRRVSSLDFLDEDDHADLMQLGNRSVLDVVVGGGDSIPDRFAVVVGRVP
ncbi:MAG: hypothetical protein IRZ17_22610, partial [Mycolicibacterium hassiacum]|nr:hypothetical protein [Mycolicibacterium hassiacum]